MYNLPLYLYGNIIAPFAIVNTIKAVMMQKHLIKKIKKAMTRPKPVLLCILDGWGLNPSAESNAVAMANTPSFDALWDANPHTTLRADGAHVGLPDGQFGNSEVGHLNIGAGRVVMQSLPRISKAVTDNTLKDIPALQDFITALKDSGGTAHLMGLLSDGGVHAHIDHIIGLTTVLAAQNIPVNIHVFTDGRDTPPKSAGGYITTLEDAIAPLNNTRITTVSGRFYAMDRDNRWERVSQAYNAIVHAEGADFDSANGAVETAYLNDITDEFIEPTVIDDYMGLRAEDGILFANFRADRAREILRALTQPDFSDFDRKDAPRPITALGMVSYSDDLNTVMTTLFPPEVMTGLLGETVAKAGLTQLRTAETEKYPHVTFFFNGGEETPADGEERILVPSPKVATYDLQPEMSAIELTDKLVEAIENNSFDMIIINYANADMVGHTGDIPAAIKAVETVDACVGRVASAIKKMGGTMLITADHGNADVMVDPVTGEPHTAHTTNPVPLILVGGGDVTLNDGGKLGDIAPTMLRLLNLNQPDEMTGTCLIA